MRKPLPFHFGDTMRKLLISIMLAACTCLAVEDSCKIVVPDTSSAAAVAVTTAHKFTGQLESIYIDVTAPATNTVVISGAEGTIFTDTVTADALYRPMLPVVDTAGDAIADVYTKHFLAYEALTVTVTGTYSNATDAIITIKTR